MPQLSPQLRIFALVGALAAVGAALAMFTLGRGSAEPIAAATGRAGRTDEAGRAEDGSRGPKAAAAKPVAPPAKAAAKPKPRPAAAAPPKNPPLAPSGFPAAVDAALRSHEVVVVSLYFPGARVDELADRRGARRRSTRRRRLRRAERARGEDGQAAARQAGHPRGSVLLVVKRPGVLALRISGFVDRDTVAQAAANASS